MRQFLSLSTLFIMALIVTAGCSNDPNPVSTPKEISPESVNPATGAIPSDATIDSARFFIHAFETDTQSVTVHQITSAWDEAGVTWTNFASAFNTNTIATLSVDDTGWYSVDVSTEVQDWFDSTIENFGFLLQPDISDTGLSTHINSDDAGSEHPFLEVFFTTHEGSSCDTLMTVADAYIYSVSPDGNYGTDTALIVEREVGEDSLYQSLIQFEFPIEIRYSSIGNFVWSDSNADGIQDDGEPGLAGVVVNLYDCDDSQFVATLTTNSTGYYSFGSLMAGDYYIEFIAPDYHMFTLANVGDNETLDSDADPKSGLSDCVTLLPGVLAIGLDAGFVVYDGCTYGKGYWKNHAGFGPQDDELSKFLPIWLGNEDGNKSIEVTTADTAVMILQQHTFGHPRNGITRLYAHLLTAKLNIANRAYPGDIEDAIAEADDFLAEYDWNDWDSLDKEQRQTILNWKSKNEMFNEGEIGPGHCGDDDNDDDD